MRGYIWKDLMACYKKITEMCADETNFFVASKGFQFFSVELAKKYVNYDELSVLQRNWTL